MSDATPRPRARASLKRIVVAVVAAVAACAMALTAGARAQTIGVLNAKGVHRQHGMLQLLAEDVQAFRAEHGRLPNSLDELPSGDAYVLDHWQNPIQVEITGDSFIATSWGADGKPGGAGLDADIRHDQSYFKSAPTLHQYLTQCDVSGNVTVVTNAAMISAGFTGWLVFYTKAAPGKTSPHVVAMFARAVAFTLLAVAITCFIGFVTQPNSW